MQTTTMMIPRTETATATGPSLCVPVGPLTCECAGPDASTRGEWRATAWRTAPWTGAPGTTVSQSSGDNRTMAVAAPTRRRGTALPPRRRSARGMVALGGSVCVPVLLQQRVAVGIMLRAADPLPPVQERFPGEPAVLGCSL
jgi:hypothetical protein